MKHYLGTEFLASVTSLLLLPQVTGLKLLLGCLPAVQCLRSQCKPADALICLTCSHFSASINEHQSTRCAVISRDCNKAAAKSHRGGLRLSFSAMHLAINTLPEVFHPSFLLLSLPMGGNVIFSLTEFHSMFVAVFPNSALLYSPLSTHHLKSPLTNWVACASPLSVKTLSSVLFLRKV